MIEGPPEWLVAMAFSWTAMAAVILAAMQGNRWIIAFVALAAGMNLKALLG